MEHTEKKEKMNDLIKDIRSCMLITKGLDGEIKARPMGTQESTFDGTIWFMTDKNSEKAKEIQNNNSVGLNYADKNGITYISISGKAVLVDDKERVHKFWNPFLKAWFTGPEDPNITLIKVTVSRAEYWDNVGGKIGAITDAAIGIITGEPNKLDENEVLEF